ncbi:MAG: hypothetical protein ACRDFW_14075 [bacterium]
MWSKRTLVVAIGGVLGGATVLALPGSVRGEGVSRAVLDERANLPDPVAALRMAEQTAPYALHLPSPLPDGAVPLVVDSIQEGGATAVDIWWSLPGAARLHIWQTDDPSLADEGKDVLSTGTAVSVGSIPWRQTATDWGGLVMTELCRKFDDGVTLCVSSNLDSAWVSVVAATIS